jgi:hypothetical protein
VPAAAAGVDVHGLLDRARCMVQACASGVAAGDHPGVRLGAALATLGQKHGRDKVTVLASQGIATFGLWLEQLIAESLGKEGRGLIPVAGEPPGDPGAYGNDRVFVHMRLGDDRTLDARGEALSAAGHPVIRISMRDALDLGEEFFRWEFATATVGAFLGVDAFDQPNVQESKDNTNRILASGRFVTHKVSPGDEGTLRDFLRQCKTGDYIALMAFINETPARDDVFDDIRSTLRDATRAATTFGYGPRFLHSTGQLHKGGPNTGLFIQLVGSPKLKLPIPGQPFDFGMLVTAQAAGDYQSLLQHGRRVLPINLGGDIDAGLATLRRTIAKIAGALSPAVHGTKA